MPAPGGWFNRISYICMSLLVTYHPDFDSMGYPPLKDRVAPAWEHLWELGYMDRPGVRALEPRPAPLTAVERAHTRRHIEDVASSGYLDVSLLSTGGVIEASELLAAGEVDYAFCFVGAAGHHASREGFWGFCFINDVAVAALRLMDEGLASRVAVVDIDPHYGDGTRDILGPDSRVLHLNFHSAFGRGSISPGPTNVDISLPHDAGDDLFMDHAEAALDRAAGFSPDITYVVFGYDSCLGDYGAFRFSRHAFRRFAAAVRERFDSGVCFVLSGGAEIDNGMAAIGAVVDVLSKA